VGEVTSTPSCLRSLASPSMSSGSREDCRRFSVDRRGEARRSGSSVVAREAANEVDDDGGFVAGEGATGSREESEKRLTSSVACARHRSGSQSS
jgi:hypothetical protein